MAEIHGFDALASSVTAGSNNFRMDHLREISLRLALEHHPNGPIPRVLEVAGQFYDYLSQNSPVA
jgi:hypothetical protein